jgi:hypothetical protein
MLLAATSSNWNPKKNIQETQKPHQQQQQQLQNLHYKRTEIRVRSLTQLGSKDAFFAGLPACAPTQQRSAAELRSSARLKSSSLCVVRARVSLRAGEGATGTAGWQPAGEAGTVCIFSLSFLYFF